MEKKIYEEPSVKKVEFEFNERIASSYCDDDFENLPQMHNSSRETFKDNVVYQA